jgi:hypothetical protein
MSPLAVKGQELPSCPQCPVCGGQTELVYQRLNQRVCVCPDCHSGVTIPATAWDVVRLKRQKPGTP